MKNILILLLGFFGSPIVYCGEAFYFGGTLSASTEFGPAVIEYLRLPSKECDRAYLDRHAVLQLHGNGLMPDHWNTTGEGRDKVFQNLVQKEYVGRLKLSRFTALDQVIYERGQNPQRRVVLEVGDSVSVKHLASLGYSLRDLLAKLGSEDWRCTVLIPLPDGASPELKQQVLKQVDYLRTFCHVFVLNDTPEAAEPRSAKERVAALLDEAKQALCSVETLRLPDSGRGY